MVEARIQILIPTCNHVDELDKTMESIWCQNYTKENIYVTIVDFDSTDGTYEKAMSYDRTRLGVYKVNEQKNEKLRIATAAKFLNYVWPGSEYCFVILLHPGEIMYPDCLKILSRKYIENYDKNITMVICECDIKLEDGNVIHQTPLFEEDRIINGNTDLKEYVRRGYTHQIFHMGKQFFLSRHKSNQEGNERRSWNKLTRMNSESFIMYVHEPLACTKRVIYQDEFQEVLDRWEAIISIIRNYTSRYGHGYGDEFERMAKENLAEYALWKSFLLYQRKSHWKDIEDCFLIASVIHGKVVEKEIYRHMQRLIIEKACEEEQWLQGYYASIY